MKVEAIKLGFYGNKRRYEGDVFHIADEKAFSKKWMKKVDSGSKQSRKPKPEVKPEVDLNSDVI